MADFLDAESIATSLRAFTDNPTPSNRQALRAKVAPYQSTDPTDISGAADHALSYLDNAYISTGQIHAGFVEAAGMIGVDPATLGGGQTPEE
jgi:hypothetical protein